MSHVVLHADLNSFYASVACLEHPEWREIPLAVSGDPDLRHGIVLAKNTIAKRQGVITGQAIWQAKQSCPNLHTVRPELDAILRYSHTVRGIFSRYTNRVQPFGVDEAWLDVSGPSVEIADGCRIANHLRHTVREETGLTISVGVGDSRVFAKLGSDLKKPDGVSVVCQENRTTVLDPLPVGELLFIGRATSRKLQAVGIYTIGQLAAADPSALKAIFGKTGLMLSGFARGNDASAVLAEDETTKMKSVGNSTTTVHDMLTKQDVRITLYALCESVASRMRKHEVVGNVVRLSVRHAATLEWFQRQQALGFDTDCSFDLFACAYELLLQNWQEGIPLRSLGVSVTHLSVAGKLIQLSFLPEDAARQKRQILEYTIDDIRKKYGHFAIERAVMHYDRGLGKINPEDEHVLCPLPPAMQR
ncbi:MAG TPA: DNA polymerase IV [Candidatus Limiplasma sp.]|nr:DNA polymerase IV [Candidatus Limiplasma sp.]